MKIGDGDPSGEPALTNALASRGCSPSQIQSLSSLNRHPMYFSSSLRPKKMRPIPTWKGAMVFRPAEDDPVAICRTGSGRTSPLQMGVCSGRTPELDYHKQSCCASLYNIIISEKKQKRAKEFEYHDDRRNMEISTVTHTNLLATAANNLPSDPRLVLSALKAAQVQAKQEGVAMVQMINEATASQSANGHIDFYA